MSKYLIVAITLEAMARNYADGNLWDDLDRKAVCEAARVIREQEAEIAKLDKALSVALEALEDKIDAAVEPSEIDDIIGNAIDHCGYFMEGPVKQKVMLAARCVRVALTNAGLLASSPAPAVEPSEEAINKSFEFLNIRLCEFGDKAEMRNLLCAAYAIDRISPPRTEK
jgi:hypothetical protein